MTAMENINMEDSKQYEYLSTYFSPNGQCWWINDQFGYPTYYIDIQVIKKRLNSRVSELKLFESFDFSAHICIKRNLKNGIIHKPICEKYIPQQHSIWIPLNVVYTNEKFNHTINRKFPDITFI